MIACEKDTNKGVQQYECTPESDGVNLQCINSSDFVVGKQTTFNGPVTILNYSEVPKTGEGFKSLKEEVVIKEKIITPSTVAEIQAFAESKGETGSGAGKSKTQSPGCGQKLLRTSFLKVPIVLWMVLLLVIIIGCAVFLTGNSALTTSGDLRELYSNYKAGNTSQSSDIVRRNPPTITYQGKKFNFVSREEWNARTPLLAVEMKTPVRYVIISHTASRFCYLMSKCISLIRDIQADHMTRSEPFSDIAYSFLVGGDGNIYEGRGWKVRNSITGFANSKNVNINFIGSFENLDTPTYPQTEAVKALIEYGVNNSYIAQDYSLISANSTYATLSPGIQVYKEIKNWPHFDPNPEEHLDE